MTHYWRNNNSFLCQQLFLSLIPGHLQEHVWYPEGLAVPGGGVAVGQQRFGRSNSYNDSSATYSRNHQKGRVLNQPG